MLKFVILVSLLLLTAGCGSGGSGSGLGALLSFISSSLSGGSGSSSSSSSTGGSSGFFSDTTIHTVQNPEPSSMALLATGLAGFAIAQLRKRKKS
ncbi:MAG TPA: hypothetical protein DEQ77_06775 [Candidatus Omnitrophica bacterium]|nr:hypothetical protein [Candidatus Omnitrophota bacterium]